jgi:glutamine synthetase
LRVPSSGPQSRRVENRLAGSDVNPYLAIAATLACGYLGMTEKIMPNDPITGSAYDLPFTLHAHIHPAIQAMEQSEAMRRTLGDEFVSLYCAIKTEEYKEFQEIVTPYEREVLMFNV